MKNNECEITTQEKSDDIQIYSKALSHINVYEQRKKIKERLQMIKETALRTERMQLIQKSEINIS